MLPSKDAVPAARSSTAPSSLDSSNVSPGDTDPMVTLSGVYYSYRGQPVLNGLDLQLTPGRIYALLGRNGAGKSTTVKLMLGLLSPDLGTVQLFGQPFERASLCRVGASVDGPALFGHLSAQQNLLVHARLLGIDRMRIAQVLQVCGLDTAGRKAAAKYSTGMKARLALAIALLGDPELLILDEPQNGLDPEGVREFRELIKALAAQGRTVLVSSHLLGEVVQLADDIGVLADGRLQYQGPLNAFAPNGDLEQAYFAATQPEASA